MTSADFIAQLNDRLLQSKAILTQQRSAGYVDERWNGLLLIRIDVRGEDANGYAPIVDILARDEQVFRRLEETMGGTFTWDEDGHGDGGSFRFYRNYLLDDRVDSLKALSQSLTDAFSVVSEDERTEHQRGLQLAP